MLTPKSLRLIGPLLVGLLALTMSAVAWAQPGPKGRGRGPEGDRGPRRPGGMLLNAPMDRLTQRLDLTDEQRARLEEVRKRYVAATEADWAEVRRLRGEMQKLWTSGEVPTKKAVQSLRTEMMSHRTKVMDAMVDARIEALTALRPEQRKQLAPGPGRGGGRGRGRGPGSGPDR